jgi:hypothetical protein
MSVAVLTLHRFYDRRREARRSLGPVIGVRDVTGAFGPELSRLGFTFRHISGARERGGPGKRVPGVWVVPASRWDADQVLQATVRLLMARNNGAPLREVEALQEQVRELRSGDGRREQATGNREQIGSAGAPQRC